MRTGIAVGVAVVAAAGFVSTASAQFLAGDALQGGERIASRGYSSLFGANGSRGGDPLGDTYTGEALAQDGINAFFIDDTASLFAFDAFGEFAGNNLTNAGSTFLATEAYTDLGATHLIQVEMASLDAAGALSDWITLGELSGNGVAFTTWRLDIGTVAGGPDPIDIPLLAGESIVMISSGFIAFDVGGNALGTFALTVDGSNATSVSGLGVIGLGGGDIAGFGFGSIQLFWEFEIIPAPSSMIVLAFGGLIATRRRR